MRTVLEVAGASTLAWDGDHLVDWAGCRRIALDGTVQSSGVAWSYVFDRAQCLGNAMLLVAEPHTKALLVRDRRVLREIDRSFYHAHHTPFPARLFTLPDGRPAIAHCPRDYCELELELLDGTPLTRRTIESYDVFHARLAASPDGRWLVSAGWRWHPQNHVHVYDVARALADPAHLAGEGLALDHAIEYASEAEEDDDCDREVEAVALVGDRLVTTWIGNRPELRIVSLPDGAPLATFPTTENLGTALVPWGPDHVVALDGYPRVVSLATGAIVERWPDVRTDAQLSPALATSRPLDDRRPRRCRFAIDPRGDRFAIADDQRITVVTR